MDTTKSELSEPEVVLVKINREDPEPVLAIHCAGVCTTDDQDLRSMDFVVHMPDQKQWIEDDLSIKMLMRGDRLPKDYQDDLRQRFSGEKFDSALKSFWALFVNADKACEHCGERNVERLVQVLGIDRKGKIYYPKEYIDQDFLDNPRGGEHLYHM